LWTAKLLNSKHFHRGWTRKPHEHTPNSEIGKASLVQKFPEAQTLATPFNDPIAKNIEEYQDFLKTLGYSSLAQGAFGKRISAT